ncbi:hypothetical protein NQ317_010044 [Molorchus minor]|uniref:Mitochondrial inner membrane protein Mpv17 n=1 Tax=Molorchus minor TaxID=1323400 RepID=A0ABQ9J7A6_9CUCU|nr:hypothetical protein NQ317_010044 [Molorchus minor]
MMSMGDLLAQAGEKGPFKEVDLIRTSHFLILGTGLVGPAVANWYKILLRTFGDSGSAALKKMAADQLIFAPISMAVFMTALNTLQGKSLEEIKKEIDAKYKDLLIANYKLWPAVQLINFYMMPMHYQVLFAQSVALFWNAYVSWKLRLEIKD